MPNEIPKESSKIRYIPSGHAPDLTSGREKREQQRQIKSKCGAVIHRLPLTAVRLDPDRYPQSQRRQPPIRKQLDLLREGQKLSPVKVMEDQSATEHRCKRYVLVEGYATWKALQKRAKLHGIGKWNTNLSQIELDMVQVELVDTPVYQRRSRSLRDRIRILYRESPGYPKTRAAKELGCDIKTIRKYAADLVEQWKEQSRKAIKKMRAKGKPSREIAQTLKTKWPWARGLSQPAITRKVGKPPRL